MEIKDIIDSIQVPKNKNQEPIVNSQEPWLLPLGGLTFSIRWLTKYKLRLSILIIFLNIIFSMQIIGQDNRSDNDCLAQLEKSFITDGQDHQITIHNSKFSQLHVIFYPQFTYRVVICDKNEKIPIEFNLTKEHGEVIFNNETTKYKREWNFKFSSLMKGIINIKLISKDIKEQTIKIIIAYKITDEK